MDTLTIGLAQIAPVWLNRAETMSKILNQVQAARGLVLPKVLVA